MKKIIFTVTNDLTYDQRMDRICDTLAHSGFEVELVGRQKKESLTLKHKSYSQKRIKCLFEKGKFFYLEYNFRLFFYLLRAKYDIICSIDLDTLLPGYWVSNIRSKPLVYDAHEYFTEVIEVVNRPIVKKVWSSLEAMVLPNLKYAYTVSESIKDIFEKKYKTKFELIRNISLLEEYIPTKEKKEYIIYIGAVNEGRGLEEFIEAMKFIDSQLFICGKGDIFDHLVAKVKMLGLEDKVIFKGFVDPEDLKVITRNASLGILLLEQKGLSYYYSLANKFFDYMHACIPQITSNFPEYRLINNKYKVAELIDLNIENIIKATNRLLSDKKYYDEMVENCKMARQEYNWQKESERLVDFYKRIHA